MKVKVIPIVRKITCCIVDFAEPADHKVKIKENWKRDKYSDLAKKTKKDVEYKGDGDTSCNWGTWKEDWKC